MNSDVENRIRIIILIGLIFFCLFLASKAFASGGIVTSTNLSVVGSFPCSGLSASTTITMPTSTTQITLSQIKEITSSYNKIGNTSIGFDIKDQYNSSTYYTYSENSGDVSWNETQYLNTTATIPNPFKVTFSESSWCNSSINLTFYSLDYPSLSLAYPSSSITNPIRILNNWVIYATGLSNKTGQVGIDYGQTSSSLNFTQTCNIIAGASTCLINNTTSTYAITNVSNLIELSQDNDIWYARPYFFNSETLEFTYGNLVEFRINNTGTQPPTSEIPNTIYVYGSGSNDIPNTPGYFNPNTTSTAWCTPPEDLRGSFWSSSTIATLANYFTYSSCKIAEFLFVPHSTFTNFLTNQTQQLLELPPINIVYAVISPLLDANDIAHSTSTTTMNIKNIGELQILQTDTFESEAGQETADTLKDWVDTILWIAAGATAIAIIF